MASTDIRVVIDDVPMGGMKQVESGGEAVLFFGDAAGIRAFQAKCPHYGAPLAEGAICDGKLYCPWHKAVFDVGRGSLLEPPALESLTRYPVRIEEGVAIASMTPMEADKPKPSGDGRHVVVVGTGAAAVAAVTTLRREGFAGRITMIGREQSDPYDRPKLSKQFLAKPTKAAAALLDDDFYAAHKIEAIKQAVIAIEPDARRVTLEDELTIQGDAVLIATGSRAVRPDLSGLDLGNVFTLRSLEDAERLSEAAVKGAAIVVIGSGFIGLEAAASLTKRGLRATVVSPEAAPFAKRFGDEVGAAIKAYHEGNGITFIRGEVARVAGAEYVDRVELKDGASVPADMVLVGAGAAPETSLFDTALLREDGGVSVDSSLAIAPGVWVAGDIAAFPERRSGSVARIEHWRLAEQHGAHVARAILGANEPFEAAPFFWTNQGEKRLDYAGYAPEWDEIVTDGDVRALDFISYYVRDGKALAACAVGRNDAMIAFLHQLGTGRAPDVGLDGVPVDRHRETPVAAG